MRTQRAWFGVCVSVLCGVFGVCAERDETQQVTSGVADVWESDAALSNALSSCHCADDIVRCFGQPSSVNTFGKDDTLWSYERFDALLKNEPFGFTVKLKDDGEIIWWQPILTSTEWGGRRGSMQDMLQDICKPSEASRLSFTNSPTTPSGNANGRK